MRVGVVGAGVAGLAAARHLASNGSEVTVFESATHVGGRCSTLTLGAYTFDPGATSIVPRGREIERVMLEELDKTDLVKIDTPVYTHDGRRVFLGVGLPPTARYCYRHGIRTLADLLANGLHIETGKKVDTIEAPSDGGFSLLEQTFEALVLTAPMTESMRLMSQIGDVRRAYNTRYRPCLSVLLGIDNDFHTPYHAVVAEESVHPLHWLSIENIKVPGRAPAGHTALVVQLGPKYSKWNFDASDDSIVEDALVDVERVLGPGFDRPVVQHVVRWRESQPDSVSGFESMNPPGSKLVVAGDGLEGGRVEHAYDSGIKAAKLLIGP